MKKITSLFLLAFSLVVWSCLPDPLEGDTDTQSVEDNAFVESEFNEIAFLFETEAAQSDLLKKTDAVMGYFCSCSGADVTANANGTFTMVIDYGTGCTCLDGRTRSGQLVGTFSGKWQPGTTLSITPVDYKVKGLNGVVYELSFDKTITYTGPNTAGNTEIRVQVANAQLASPDGVIFWNSDRITEWISGQGDFDPSNNVYLVRGSADGKDVNGLNFDVTIDQALRLEGSCPNVVSGVLSLKPDGKLKRTIDYGNGNCDREATITIGSFSRTILLR